MPHECKGSRAPRLRRHAWCCVGAAPLQLGQRTHAARVRARIRQGCACEAVQRTGAPAGQVRAPPTAAPARQAPPRPRAPPRRQRLPRRDRVARETAIAGSCPRSWRTCVQYPTPTCHGRAAGKSPGRVIRPKAEAVHACKQGDTCWGRMSTGNQTHRGPTVPHRCASTSAWRQALLHLPRCEPGAPAGAGPTGRQAARSGRPVGRSATGSWAGPHVMQAVRLRPGSVARLGT